MSKKYFETESPIRKHFALSDLPSEEISLLLEQDQEETGLFDAIFDDELIPPFGEITQRESELFTEICAGLSKGSMTYGQAILLTALYATTIEDRVRLRLNMLS